MLNETFSVIFKQSDCIRNACLFKGSSSLFSIISSISTAAGSSRIKKILIPFRIRKLEGQQQNRRSKGKEVNFFRPVKPTMTNGPLIGEFAVPNKIANIFKHRSGSPLFRSGGPLTGCSNMFCNDGKSLKNLLFATLPKWTHITVFESRRKKSHSTLRT